MLVGAMLFGMRNAACLALAAAAFASAPASAQPPEAIRDGLRCVYEKLTANRGYEVVAEVFLYDTVPESQVGQAASILDLATQSCAEQYKWSVSRVFSAADVGLYGATIDYLIQKIAAAGVASTAVEAFDTVVSSMSHADYESFGEQDWRSDLAFTRRLRALARDAGLPDEEAVMDMALDALELGARIDYSVALFVLDLAEGSPIPETV